MGGRTWASEDIHEPSRWSVVETAQTSWTEHLRKAILTSSECRWVQRRSWLVSWMSGSENWVIGLVRISSSRQMSIVLKPGSIGHATKCAGVAESREAHTCACACACACFMCMCMCMGVEGGAHLLHPLGEEAAEHLPAAAQPLAPRRLADGEAQELLRRPQRPRLLGRCHLLARVVGRGAARAPAALAQRHAGRLEEAHRARLRRALAAAERVQVDNARLGNRHVRAVEDDVRRGAPQPRRRRRRRRQLGRGVRHAQRLRLRLPAGRVPCGSRWRGRSRWLVEGGERAVNPRV